MKLYIDRLWTKRHGLFFLPVLVLLVLFNTGSLMRYVGQFMVTVFHEFGHAAVSWLLGYPAIPTFNVDGGITIQMHRSLIVSIIIFALLAFVLVRAYRMESRFFTTLILCAVYTVVFTQTGLCQGLIVFMGHGGEMLCGLIFCYLGLHAYSGRKKAEKFVYTVMGLHIALNVILFARSLLSDGSELERYINPSTGMTNDFVVLSDLSGKSIGFFAVLLIFSFIISAIALFFLLAKKRHIMASHKNNYDEDEDLENV